MYEMTCDPEDAPDKAETLRIEFKKGKKIRKTRLGSTPMHTQNTCLYMLQSVGIIIHVDFYMLAYN